MRAITSRTSKGVLESVGMIPVDVEELLLSVAENVDMSKYLNFAQEQDIFSVPGYLFENGYLLPAKVIMEHLMDQFT